MIARRHPGREARLRAARFGARAQAAAVAIIAAVVWLPAVLAQSDSSTLAGRRLEDALRVLQAQGLRIVFTSELVTSDQRVRLEPRAKTARAQLTEILEPHGLAAESGPGGVIQIVRAKRPSDRRTEPRKPDPPKRAEGARTPLSAHDPVYWEQVTVTPTARGPIGAGRSGRYLGPDALREFGGHIADDPLRLVQSLPAVAAADDFRAEYSVRGSLYRHAGLVVDGVVANWLQHAAPGRGHTGTLTMLRGDVVGEAALFVGAYPRHDGGQLGPQLNLSLREGTRVGRRLRLGISGTASTLTAEGPLGPAKRGSWLIGLRKSHVEWPIGRSDHDATVFGYGDVQSKLAYDVRPGQQVGLTVVAGLSNVERDDPAPLSLADGLNGVALAGISWRSMIGSHAVVAQRVSTIAREFLNRGRTARPSSRGTDGARAYRVNAATALFGGVLEAGALIQRVHGSRQGPAIQDSPTHAIDVSGSWLERSGYASFRHALPGGVVVNAGARVADSTLARRRTVDRWLQAERAAGAGWVLHGSTGVMHQFPAIDHVRRLDAEVDLRPERAAYVDGGIGRRLSLGFRWDVTLFARHEHGVLAESAAGVTPIVLDPLNGSARGVELTLEGRARRGISGWASYSYGVARYTDVDARATFPADFDQRHAFNISSTVALPWRAKARVTFRGGSNFPIPGYLDTRDGRLFLGERRNEARLPPYARLDVRIERTFVRAARRFTIFGEMLNVLNHANASVADGSIDRVTGEAVGFTDRLYPRLFTAGLRIEF